MPLQIGLWTMTKTWQLSVGTFDAMCPFLAMIYRNKMTPEFCGRVEQLNLIDRAVRPSREGMMRQQSYGIYGMEGVDKSVLLLPMPPGSRHISMRSL